MLADQGGKVLWLRVEYPEGEKIPPRKAILALARTFHPTLKLKVEIFEDMPAVMRQALADMGGFEALAEWHEKGGELN